jgi:hypothetical protein
VDAAELLEHSLVEALDADGEAVHAGVTESAKAASLHRARICLQRDFRARLYRDAGANAREQRVDGLRGEQARRPATDENAGEPPAPHRWQQLFQVGEQALDVLVFRQGAGALVRVEVAIRTLAHAPRDMDVKRERRQRGEAHLAWLSERLIHAAMLIASGARSRGG